MPRGLMAAGIAPAFRALVVLAACVGVARAAGDRGGQRPDFSHVIAGVVSSAPVFHMKPPEPTETHSAVPERCRQWQRVLATEAHTVFGLDAPIAPLAAQIEAESACRPDAHSSVGACGLTQFMPETAADIAARYPILSPPACADPRWAIAAQVRYMHELASPDRAARTDCDRWAFGLSAYNGGDGWVRRDQRACTAAGHCDWQTWFSNVELHSARSSAAMLENRTYVRRILLDYQPRYAGWGASVACAP